MSGTEVFADANVVLYSLSFTEPDKSTVARRLIAERPWVSPQVLFECLNVMLRKWRLPKDDSIAAIRTIMVQCAIVTEDAGVAGKALDIFERFSLQGYDSKIVASALHCNASVLYSEDMQDGLVIEGRLTIVNPFL